MLTTASREKKIMVTRPAHQAGPLLEKIRSTGTEVLAFPTLAIEPVKPAELSLEQPLENYHIMIFISPNAVEHGLDYLQKHKPIPATTLFATVGKGSAHALLHKLGKAADIIPENDFTSEGLLAHPELHDVKSKHILIVKGIGGRDKLNNVLAQRGAIVEELNVYQRVMPATGPGPLLEDLQNQAIAAIVITSGESLKNLVKMVPSEYHEVLFQVPLVLVNERIKTIALESGFKASIHLSNSAGDDAIMQALSRHNYIK